MSDDWSLNNCIKYAGRGYFIHDIETLRKKLIEDFDRCVEDGQYEDIMDYKKIINKRFGVKDNE